MRENFPPLPRARLLKVSELWSFLSFVMNVSVCGDMGSYGRKERMFWNVCDEYKTYCIVNCEMCSLRECSGFGFCLLGAIKLSILSRG